jgi:IS5 family transposase
VAPARRVLASLRQRGSGKADALGDRLEGFISRVEQVIEQTKRRVLDGQTVAAKDKLVSLFEPHTCIIKRGKAAKPTEFGRKVWLDEVDGGLVSEWRVLEGNAPDQKQWQPSLDNHVEQFGRPPYQASADRGVYYPDNERYAEQIGVRRVILPQPGHKSEARCRYERQSWFRRGRHYHAGVEGRISVLKRRHKLGRCLNHGEVGMQRWVGLGIIAGNLAVMGRTLAAAEAKTGS